MAAEGSKAKYIRDLLDKALEIKVPKMSVEEFNRVFALNVTEKEMSDLTFAEVMVRQLVMKACTGNDKSIGEVLDRLLGKPMQTTESVTKSYSYYDFLMTCRDEELPAPRPAPKPAQIVPKNKPKNTTLAEIVGECDYDPLQDLL